MKILLCSHFFPPSVGGTEKVGAILAEEFTRAGQEIRVVTTTGEGDDFSAPYPIFRSPSRKQLSKLVLWSDLVFHNNLILRMAWPLLFIRRPWIICHHTWITRTDSRVGWIDRLKRLSVKSGKNLAVSRVIAEHLPVPAVVVGNPYDDHHFFRMPDQVRDLDLVFVGRLVSDKGADLLVSALVKLKHDRGLTPALTLVGTGSQVHLLKGLVAENQLEQQVTFAGQIEGPSLAKLLNQHRVMIVPSRWQEPFGIVALEGMACGCRVIVPDQAGLKEAVGSLGDLFQHGSASSLAERIEKVLKVPADEEAYWNAVQQHLEKFRASQVAARYLEIFESALR